MKSSTEFQLVLPDQMELMKKGAKFIFRRLTERTMQITAGAITHENFTAVLQCFLQESKFLLEK